MSQKRKLLELVNDIVEEVHEASRINPFNNENSLNVDQQKQSISKIISKSEPNLEILKSQFASPSIHIGFTNLFIDKATYKTSLANLEGLSESDFSSDGMTERFLRESSIDHLLPEKPDYECDVKLEIINEHKKSEEKKPLLLESEKNS